MTSSTVELPTVEATQAFGRSIGSRLAAGDLLILSGSLGAGKTTLTKGIAAGMGVTGRVTSPTFVIARVHPPAGIERPGSPASSSAAGVPLVHVDAYRLAGTVELDDLDLDTDLAEAAVVVEWGEGVADQLSDARLIITLTRLPDDTRKAELTPIGGSWIGRVGEIVAEQEAFAGVGVAARTGPAV
ncbi:MAG: tRNA (adenosine(37)-N6)-threonylcarbamoyltransferase complex ATPase subunit type 1 TsaE [Nakamurella sp.]